MTPEERFQKIEAGIVDLIGAARLTLDATQNLMGAIQNLMETTKTLGQKLESYAAAAEARSKELDERMNALIHTVDDLVRDRWRRKNGETEN